MFYKLHKTLRTLLITTLYFALLGVFTTVFVAVFHSSEITAAFSWGVNVGVALKTFDELNR